MGVRVKMKFQNRINVLPMKQLTPMQHLSRMGNRARFQRDNYYKYEIMIDRMLDRPSLGTLGGCGEL